MSKRFDIHEWQAKQHLTEHTVKFTKDDMAKLHNNGELVKADDEGKDHTYVFNGDLEEIEVTGMEPDSGNMEKEFNVIGPANLSDPLTNVTIEYNKQEYILDFEFGDVIDDHGSSGRDEWYEATAEDGTYFMVDVYMVHQEGTPEPQWKTLEITPSDDPRMDPAIRSDFDDPTMDELNDRNDRGRITKRKIRNRNKKMKEQNTIGANTGFSVQTGNSDVYATRKAFEKKKNK